MNAELALQIESLQLPCKDGGSLNYRRYINIAKPDAPCSLFVFLHGAGSRGFDNADQLKVPAEPIIRHLKEKQLNSIVLFPQCMTGFQWVDVPWNSLSHTLPEKPSIFMSRVLQMLDETLASYNVNPQRIYAGGISMGGYGAWDLVCRRPDDFAALLAICGGGDIAQAPKLKQLPIYMLHGALDNSVPCSRSREMMAALEKAGNTQSVYIEYPDLAHNVWDACFADEKALQWLYEQKKPG